ncbi:MAG: endonuclease [Clostridia bacterium]|nr:endonuclease [Clostridia bacterium]
MNNILKRGLAVILVLVCCISTLPFIGMQAEAAEVTYKYADNGKYIYNWGTRGTVATFMSPNAEKFYDKYTSYDVLSTYAGGTGTSDAPNSALFKALQDMMKSAHSYITSYDATKSLFQYTDCQGGGGKISSFYSGNQIGPTWNGGWNREHTWPNSKGLGGSDENDLMMLRPTSTSENSSRGNTAYGKSSGYYNPNNESNNKYDLRGDVARIFLYVYVRWGNRNYAWGKSGVMESLDVMLEWMEADPVDTWELGRNDSVESITGTRNVFVDYPELGFLLFGEEIPSNMTTPSGASSKKCSHNNFDAGTTVPATCTTKGYTIFKCKTSGCTYSYKTNYVEAKNHNYVSGTCSLCGAKEAVKPTYATSVATGKAYKLGFYSDAAAMEYYFTGAMSGYYGATDSDQTKGVDVFVETATGGYYLYFKDSSNKKQYINLVLATGSDGNEHYNFTFGTTASSVYTWDSAKNALKTNVSGEQSYIGTYGSYFTMSVLTTTKLKDTDYIARLYTTDGSGSSGGSSGGNTDVTPPATCTHKYTAIVIKPNCVSGGFTAYTCSLCGDTYTGDKTSATGHNFSNNKCTVCGADEPTNSGGTTVIISFTDKANLIEYNTSKQVWKQSGITVTNNKANSQSDVKDYSNPARFYQGSDVIIEYPGITKLEINCVGISDSKYTGSWLNAPDGATATNNNGIITVVFASPVNSVTYSNLAKQSRAMSITVYTGDGSSSGSTTPTCTHTNTTIEGTKAPTCTVDGHTGNVKCTSCKQIINNGQTIKATGHNWTPADCDTPKTCTKCQATEGSALGHSFDENGKCTKCGASEGGKLPDDTTTDGTVTTDPDETTDGTDTTVPDVTGPVDTTDGEEKKDNDKDNNLVLPIIIGVVAVAAIGAVVTVIIIKKKKE